MSKKLKPIKRIGTLKNLCRNKTVSFYIRLNGGMRSSKSICYYSDNDTFWILHEIDGSEEWLTTKQMQNSFIAEAIDKEALYKY